ncbi:MAG: Ppx/GppA phosphatase family protein [Pseudomonadota bacterium]
MAENNGDAERRRDDGYQRSSRVDDGKKGKAEKHTADRHKADGHKADKDKAGKDSANKDKTSPAENSHSARSPSLNKGEHSARQKGRSGQQGRRRTYAALDLGTNNCRLLIATPNRKGFRVVDAFSRIVRLGEGVAATGMLSTNAMDRTIDALKICAEKIARRNATRVRCIATQACRAASNGEAFLSRVRTETGIAFDVIGPEEEAQLAVSGCKDLIDEDATGIVLFDIGGGSTEISFLKRSETNASDQNRSTRHDLIDWLSIPIGVVTLSEEWGGREVEKGKYGDIIRDVEDRLKAHNLPHEVERIFAAGRGSLLGTSGTVTSIAGVHLGLTRYRRDEVDGLWLSSEDAKQVSEQLRAMSFAERSNHPCIGPDRADLVVCGCAIFEAILKTWPTDRVRVADRGLREGLLNGMIAEDKKRSASKKHRQRRAGHA